MNMRIAEEAVLVIKIYERGPWNTCLIREWDLVAIEWEALLPMKIDLRNWGFCFEVWTRNCIRVGRR